LGKQSGRRRLFKGELWGGFRSVNSVGAMKALVGETCQRAAGEERAKTPKKKTNRGGTYEPEFRMGGCREKGPGAGV